ncbi:MAG: YtcA family lipoprotein [Janthinobacterium lividum]
MRKPLPSSKDALLLLPVLLITGCARSPSFNVLGSYFPGWIICIAVAVLAASLLHVVLNRVGWERGIPALPLFYFSLVLLIACTLWLVTFE